MQLEIVSAENKIFSGKAEKIVLTADLGEICVVKGHSPLLTFIKPGPLHIFMEDGGEEVVYVEGGVLEVQPQIVNVLADTVTREKEIDEQHVLRVKEAAEKAVLSGGSEEFDCSKAKAELTRAVGLLKAIKEMRKIKK